MLPEVATKLAFVIRTAGELLVGRELERRIEDLEEAEQAAPMGPRVIEVEAEDEGPPAPNVAEAP
jgi:hypothetical protein